MTVSSEQSFIEYNGDGATQTFPVPFYFILNSDISVTVADADGNLDELTYGVDFSASGGGNPDGGTATLNTAYASGFTILIYRNPPETQETAYYENGKFPAKSHEKALDKLTMLIQKYGWWFDSLALKKPSYLSQYYDANGNRIANLADPVNAQDAATKSYSDKINNRAIRVPEDFVAPTPNKDGRKNKLLGFNDNGDPIAVLPPSSSASEVLIDLAKPTGSGLVGDPLDTTVANALSRRIYTVETVTQLLAKDFSGVQDGMHVRTYVNGKGVKNVSEWVISSTQDLTTFSLTLPAGKFANLVCFPDMNYASFEFGGTDVENVAAVNEGNRVARAQVIVRKLSFPQGVFNIGAFTLDVDKRGFEFSGAGWDMTYLLSTTTGVSMHHVILDPRDRTKDRNHFYQKVNGFTIDGNIDNRGANAASRVLCSAHYAELAFKSVGHILSNVDICGLVIHWKGLTGGRTNGATSTINSLRVRYNSIKVDGYVGGASQSSVSALIHGPSTTLSSSASAGDTAINIASVSGIYIGDVLEISGGSLEAKYVVGISGSTITLDSALSGPHTSGATVRVPVYGTTFTGTNEVGQLQIGNCSGTEIRGTYAEESRVYIFAYAEALEIHGNTIGEATPSITIDSTVSKFSTIRIVCNQVSFPVAINVADRNGSVNGILDLYNFPEIDIKQNTRAQNSILVNGTYAFKSLEVERFYDSNLNDRAMTRFKFTGFSAIAASGTNTEILRFAQISSTTGYDGHTINLSCSIRRQSGLSGYLQRSGQSSLIGTTVSDSITRVVNNYAFYDSVNGADIFFGSNTGRVGIVFKGEPSGGQAVRAMINGEVTSII